VTLADFKILFHGSGCGHNLMVSLVQMALDGWMERELVDMIWRDLAWL
jgi:hypothetical protein